MSKRVILHGQDLATEEFVQEQIVPIISDVEDLKDISIPRVNIKDHWTSFSGGTKTPSTDAETLNELTNLINYIYQNKYFGPIMTVHDPNNTNYMNKSYSMLLTCRHDIDTKTSTFMFSALYHARDYNVGTNQLIYNNFLEIYGSWTDEIYTCSGYYSADGSMDLVDGIRLDNKLGNYLAKNNTSAFTPDKDYEPATKKYVDDNSMYSIIDTTTTQYNPYNYLAVSTYVREQLTALVASWTDVETDIRRPLHICFGRMSDGGRNLLHVKFAGGIKKSSGGSAGLDYAYYAILPSYWYNYATINTEYSIVELELTISGTTLNSVSCKVYAAPYAKSSSLSSYLSKTNTTEYTPSKEYHPATKKYVDDKVAEIVSFDVLVVDALPTEGISESTVYMIPKAGDEESNIYEEYLYTSNGWEKIGDTKVDLTNYYTKEEVDTSINDSSTQLTQYVEDRINQLMFEGTAEEYAALDEVTREELFVAIVHPMADLTESDEIALANVLNDEETTVTEIDMTATEAEDQLDRIIEGGMI